MLRDGAPEPLIFLDDELLEATTGDEKGGFDLNGPSKMDSEDNMHQNMDDATHNNDHDAHNNADENVVTLVE